LEGGVDDNLIRQKYWNLTLLGHPYKNKYAMVEATFKLIGDVLNILMDVGKKVAYDI
jgi:DnaJ-class molecular chaperone